MRRAMQLQQQTEACIKLTLAGSVGRDLLEWLVVAGKEVEVDMRNIITFVCFFVFLLYRITNAWLLSR